MDSKVASEKKLKVLELLYRYDVDGLAKLASDKFYLNNPLTEVRKHEFNKIRESKP